jgi:hypothetical protein
MLAVCGTSSSAQSCECGTGGSYNYLQTVYNSTLSFIKAEYGEKCRAWFSSLSCDSECRYCNDSWLVGTLRRRQHSKPSSPISLPRILSRPPAKAGSLLAWTEIPAKTPIRQPARRHLRIHQLHAQMERWIVAELGALPHQIQTNTIRCTWERPQRTLRGSK